MSFDCAIEVNNLGKCYQIYDNPSQRLKQILLRGQRRYYKEFWALQDVSFKVMRGETVGIVGRNGSGKSTLLQMICGTLNPTIGGVNVKGRVAALLELGAGFNPEFTGIENIYMAASLYGLNKQDVDQRLNSIIAFADIGDYINQQVKTYSSGMYVRLAFAVIAYVDADILVVDEALAVGDAIFTQKCLRFIKRFKEKGTLIFVSHDSRSIISLCDKTIWLDSGRLIEYGTTKEIVERYTEYCYKLASEEVTTLIQKSVSINLMDDSEGKAKGELSKKIEVGKSEATFYSNIEKSESWTTGGAQIVDVQIDGSYTACCTFKGGEDICLKILANVNKKLKSVIVGFILKDELGQAIFGSNTFNQNETFAAAEGDVIVAKFTFKIPLLADGKYFLTAAIADGNLIDHEQQHWIHDALIVSVISNEKSYGLIRPEFKDIRIMRKVDAP